jgi:tetratricopeptide (TPR) repeat protein
MSVWFAILSTALSATPILQDDREFGRQLAERRLFDLAEEALKKVPDQDSVQLDRAQVRAAALGRIESPKARIDEAKRVIEQIRQIIAQSPDSVEAHALLSEVLQLAGRAHAALGDAAAANAAFAEAAADCTALAKRLPPGDEQLMAFYHAYRAQFARIETMPELPVAMADLEALRKDFSDFVLSYENSIGAVDAILRYANAYLRVAQAQAAVAVPACERSLDWMGKAGLGTLATDPKFAGNEEIRDLVLRGIQQSMAARHRLGTALAPAPAAKKHFLEALKLCDQAFGWYPAADAAESGMRVLLERAKANLSLGETAKASTILRRLFARPKGRVVILAAWQEFVKLLDRDQRFELAGCAFDSQDYLLSAQILEELAPKDSRCWMRIGECYYAIGRYPEAVAAFKSVLKDPAFEETRRAAGLTLKALRTLKKATGEVRYDADIQSVQDLMFKNKWVDYEEARNRAIDLGKDGKFKEALQVWDEFSEDKDLKVRLEALSQAGWSRLRLQEPALDTFKKVIEIARNEPHLPSESSVDVLNALQLGAQILVQKGDGKGLLQFLDPALLEKCPGAKPDQTMSFYFRRIEGHLLCGRPQDADADFKELRLLYEKSHSGLDLYRKALNQLATACDKAKLQEKTMEYLDRLQELGGGDFDLLLRMAVSAFDLKQFARSRSFCEQLLGNHAAAVARQKDLEFKLRYLIVRCHRGEGNPAKALAEADALLQNNPDPELEEMRGDILYDLAQTLDGADRAAKFEASAKSYWPLMKRYRTGDVAAYFRNVYKWCRADKETSAGQARLADYFKSARCPAPEWGGSEYKDELNKIKKEIELKGR